MTTGSRPRRLARRRSARILAPLALVTLVAASLLTPAVAANAVPSATWAPASQTAEYGTDWFALATITESSCYASNTGYCDVTIDYTGTKTGTFTATAYPIGSGTANVYLDPSLGGSATSFLGVGGYSFVLTYSAETSPDPVKSPPFQLTVTPANLATSVLVTADPLAARNAVVSVNLTGAFVDSFGTFFAVGMPAGTWRILIKDANGGEVLNQEVDGAAGGPPYLSIPWTDVPPGTIFSVAAEFQVSGSAGENFNFTQASGSFTSADEPTPTATPTPTPLPSADAPTGVAIPVWLLVLLGLITIGCGIAIAVLLVRRRPKQLAVEGEVADVE